MKKKKTIYRLLSVDPVLHAIADRTSAKRLCGRYNSKQQSTIRKSP